MHWHIATFSTLLKNTKQHCNTASCAKANIFWTVNPAHNHWTCWLAQFWLGLHMLHLSSGIIRSYAISWPDTTFVFKLKHRLSHSTHKHEQEPNQKHTITYLTLPCFLISFSSRSLWQNPWGSHQIQDPPKRWLHPRLTLPWPCFLHHQLRIKASQLKDQHVWVKSRKNKECLHFGIKSCQFAY